MHKSVTFIVPVRRDPRVYRLARQLSAVISSDRIIGEVIVVGDSYEETLPRHVRFVKGVDFRKGSNVRIGVANSYGDTLVICDADLDFDYSVFERLLEGLNVADIVIGMRAADRESNCLPAHRWLMSRIFRRLVDCFFSTGSLDIQSGLKAYRRSAAMGIFQRQIITGFGFEVEVLCRAKILNLIIAQVPISWVHSPGSTVNPLGDSISMFADIIRVYLSYGGAVRINEKGFYRSLNAHRPQNDC